MLFNTDTFLFLFLPAVLLGFYALGTWAGRRAAVAWVAASSLFFYGHWRLEYLALLIFSVVFNYGVGRLLARRANSSLLALGVTTNLGLLAYFKYTHFLIDNVARLSGLQFAVEAIVLPIGISFFTFQQIAFLVDARRGLAREVDFVDYTLFVTFFPQLIAGPIVHHGEMMGQFAHPRTGRFVPSNLAIGLTLFIIGLFKKVVLADTAALYATPVFDAAARGAAIGMWPAWQGALGYTVQIYFDFSGYSDMAIGLGRMFGIRLPLNFDSPYASDTIAEFWRRWHMTLSRFLRDYLYFPLGGNRRGPGRRHLNLMLVMLGGGVWHGAAWTFALWGGLHGLYLIVHRLWARRRRPLPRGVALLITLLCVVFAWVPFRADSIESAQLMFSSMLGLNGFGHVIVDGAGFAFLCIAMGFCMFAPNTQQILREHQPAIEAARPPNHGVWIRWQPSFAAALCVAALALVSVVRLWNVSEFLYFQF